jgi:hypothetical protein
MQNNWFKNVFGFNESTYNETRKILTQMFRNEKNESLNGVKVGNFRLLNNQQLFNLTNHINIGHNNGRHGRVTVENIIADIKDIHKNNLLSQNATIQVASQFNCLEMVNPSKIPEDGITCYQYDRTQGPICAMSAPAGLAYRNYIFNGGQTQNSQVDMASDLLNFLRNLCPEIEWNMVNGYLMFDKDEDLRRINNILVIDQNFRREARNLIKVGIHSNQGVFIDNTKYEHLVNHVYCSGLPISYNNLSNSCMWYGLGEIFLEAMYENTLFAACMNNKNSGQNMPCYLTQIGGGVFGMEHWQIIRAIQRACQIIAKRGFNLDVKIVHYGNINPEYNKLPLHYPIYVQFVDSIWDNHKWIRNFC